ncbi:MAG: hypothetical protein ABSG65_31175 [Bryobacteraceae bacterium]|jgi:hypothetical protein
MTIFDLLFIALFLATVVTLLNATLLALRGQGARALAILRRLGIYATAYLAIVAIASIFLPRTVLRVGEPHCFDDWCITVENAARQSAGGSVAYNVALRLSSSARRISQRENNVAVYMTDDRARRYDPQPRQPEVPFNIQLGPQESVTATRIFALPADARKTGLVVTHEGGFPIGWFIIGYETWFRKPAIVWLG